MGGEGVGSGERPAARDWAVRGKKGQEGWAVRVAVDEGVGSEGRGASSKWGSEV